MCTIAKSPEGFTSESLLGMQEIVDDVTHGDPDKVKDLYSVSGSQLSRSSHMEEFSV